MKYLLENGIAPLINLNPFMFPSSIHVLEHVDGLIEIFNVCWPMYDAMSAFLKTAILKSYESVGWDLGASVFEGRDFQYPDFEILADQLDLLIGQSDYAAEVKSNYRGALITRIRSLTVGLNRFIFTREQTPYSQLFDENCILDISRVKSTETKALIMGLMVYILNEYRISTKEMNNSRLRHVTVLEEAHNLLKNVSQSNTSELMSKSVEILTQTIAEIRTYGEGFMIVDQSPSSVDIAAIKNTNTKIVLRTPEVSDREIVGRSMGMNDEQINEIAKLPSGVAAIYQNDWTDPILVRVDKAQVVEKTYRNPRKSLVISKKLARKLLVKMLLSQWIEIPLIDQNQLLSALMVLDLEHKERESFTQAIAEYTAFSGKLVIKNSEIAVLGQLIRRVLDITDRDLINLPDINALENLVKERLGNINNKVMTVLLHVMTTTIEDNDD